jgi:hypothetical protein
MRGPLPGGASKSLPQSGLLALFDASPLPMWTAAPGPFAKG